VVGVYRKTPSVHFYNISRRFPWKHWIWKVRGHLLHHWRDSPEG
jgi:hypothetical protein